MITRPTFPNAQAYVQHVNDCLQADREPWDPATTAELQAACREFPEMSHRWRPDRREQRRLGIARPKLISERLQERFIATMAEDHRFKAAVRSVLRG